jgi:hypothetical protein
MSLRHALLCLMLVALPLGNLFAGSKDTRSLQKIEPVYVDLSKEYTSDDTQFRVWTGKVFPGFTFCKGRYIAHYKDRRGTYFAPPEGCNAPLVVGVWVPDNAQKDNFDTWLIVKRTNLRQFGILIDWLDSLEAGNYKKNGFSIIGPAFIEEFSHPNKLVASP